MIGRDLVVKVFGHSIRLAPEEIERQQTIAQVLNPEVLQRGHEAIDSAVLVEARPPRPVGLRDGATCPLCPSAAYAGPGPLVGVLHLRDDPIDGPRLECDASSFHNFPTPKESTDR